MLHAIADQGGDLPVVELDGDLHRHFAWLLAAVGACFRSDPSDRRHGRNINEWRRWLAWESFGRWPALAQRGNGQQEFSRLPPELIGECKASLRDCRQAQGIIVPDPQVLKAASTGAACPKLNTAHSSGGATLRNRRSTSRSIVRQIQTRARKPAAASCSANSSMTRAQNRRLGGSACAMAATVHESAIDRSLVKASRHEVIGARVGRSTTKKSHFPTQSPT